MKPFYTVMLSLSCFAVLLPSLFLGGTTQNIIAKSSLIAKEPAPRPIPSLDLGVRLQPVAEIVLRPRYDPAKFVSSIPFNDLSSPDHILILCFHDFGAGAKLDGLDYPAFETFVRRLKDKGYQNLTSHKLLDFLYGNIPFQGKWVLFTFDDGLTSQIKAAEILNQYGYSTLLNIISNRTLIGGYTLDPERIKSILSMGHELGSHTSEHCKLTLPAFDDSFFRDNPPGPEENCDPFQPSLLTRGQVAFQLKDSKGVMEKIFGVDINAVAYPYGFYNAVTLEESRKAGYRLGFRAPSRINDDVYEYSSSFDLPRVEVHRKNLWKLM